MRKSLFLAVVTALVIGVAGQSQSPQLTHDYPQRILHLPVQQQASAVAQGVLTVNGRVNQLGKSTGERFDKDEDRIDTLDANTTRLFQYLKDQELKQRIDDLEGQLKDFRTVMCPLIKNSKVNNDQKDAVEKVCPTESDKQK